MYTIPEGKKRSTLLALIDVFVAISEKKPPNKSNKTRAFLRELFRLDLSTAQYTLLCYVPGHCFNACGINPQTNEIFCRERWLNIAVFDGKGGMKSVSAWDLHALGENASLQRWIFSRGFLAQFAQFCDKPSWVIISKITGWWQLKNFVFSPRMLGK